MGLPEMAQIGVERLGASHGKEHGAERDEADIAMAGKKGHGMGWIEGSEHARVVSDMTEARQANREEPQRHHRAEKCCDARRAAQAGSAL